MKQQSVESESVSCGRNAFSSVARVVLLAALAGATSMPRPVAAAEIWNGQRMTFTKANLADWTNPTNQDRITTNAWLTRKNTAGLYNIKLEAASTTVSPTNTEWAYGTTADLPLTFRSWYGWNNNSPTSTIGSNAVVHLISDDIYIDIKFLSFAGGGSAGGFSYQRAGHIYMTLNGAASMTVPRQGTYTDPGATATDSARNPLAVTTNGAVDTNTVGDYVLTYTATDAAGITGLVTRAVTVLPSHTLTVQSDFGTAVPAGAGLYTNNSFISARVTSPVVDVSGATQYVCAGGAIAGLAPASYTQVSATNITLTLTNDATLTWLWNTQYLAVASAGPNGSVTPTNGSWVDRGATTVSYTGAPNAGFGVDIWSVNGVSVQTGGTSFAAPNLTGPVTVYVTFFQQTATPTFSPDGGAFPDSIPVTVNCGTAGATIRYTTSGADPTVGDPVVANGGTVLVANTLTLKAKASAPGSLDSAVKSAGYVILDPRVSITSPSNGTVFSSSTVTVLVSAASAHGGGITAVRFYVGTNWIGTVTNAPYAKVWVAPSATNYVLRATAQDASLNVTTSMSVHVFVTSALWERAADVGGGWRYLPWFGYFKDGYGAWGGWIWHAEHGWLYPVGTSTSGVWFWSPRMGAWLWTIDSVYPFLFYWLESSNSWLWYYKGTGNGNGGWFYNYATGKIEWR